MNILVIVPHKIASMGYMKSQVVSQFSSLASIGHNVTLLSVCDLRDDSQTSFYKELQSRKIQPFCTNASFLTLFTYLKNTFHAAGIIREFKPDAIYVREVWGALVVFLLRHIVDTKNIICVYDVRGAVPEEILLTESRWKGAVKNRIFSILEKMAIINATLLNAVTDELSNHIFKKYGRKTDTVIPCCVEKLPSFDDSIRVARRKSFGFSMDETVYVYSGGLSRWQLFEETVELFSSIAEVDASARLLVLTPESESASQITSKRLSPDLYYVLSVPQKDVTSFIQAGDIGFLLRDDNVVNRVAFPIKFAEYLAAGLPVISTQGAAEIANIINSENLGLLVSLQNKNPQFIADWANEVFTSREKWRTRCRTYVTTKLVWEAYSESFMKLYKTP